MKRFKELMATLWHQLDLAMVILAGVVSFVVMVLDTLNWLPEGSKLPNVLSVVLLATLAIYLIRERRQYFEVGQKSLEDGQNNLRNGQDRLLTGQTEIKHLVDVLQHVSNDNTERIIKAIQVAEIEDFKEEFRLIEYATRRILDPETKFVDDTSWSRSQRPDGDMEYLRDVAIRHQEGIRQALRTNPQLFYREIYLFNTENKLIKLKSYETDNPKGYRCSYYKDEPNVPLIQFMVINREEVIFMTDCYPIFFAIKSEAIASLFTQYYQDHYDRATPIKPGPSFPPGRVDEIIDEVHKKWGQQQYVQ